MGRRIAALWGVLGVLAMLVEAIARLARRAATLRDMELDLVAWIALVGSLVFFGVVEGYRGFQQRFAPRVVARAHHLLRHEPTWVCVLAPIFAMALLRATPRRLFGSWALLIGIVVLVLVVRVTPSPWREIVDLGVVVGLSWGAVAILVLALRALAGHVPAIALDLPALPAPDRER